MQKIVSAAALLLSLAGASAPAFAAIALPSEPGAISPYSGRSHQAGGNANLYFGARGEMPPQYVHAQNWALCTRLYPTFNPRTGTFVGPDGLTHFCQ